MLIIQRQMEPLSDQWRSLFFSQSASPLPKAQPSFFHQVFFFSFLIWKIRIITKLIWRVNTPCLVRRSLQAICSLFMCFRKSLILISNETSSQSTCGQFICSLKTLPSPELLFDSSHKQSLCNHFTSCKKPYESWVNYSSLSGDWVTMKTDEACEKPWLRS